MATLLNESDTDSSSSSSSSEQSDEEETAHVFEGYMGVMGYQYEPKKKAVCAQSMINHSRGSGHPGQVDRPNRVGNTDWFVHFDSTLFGLLNSKSFLMSIHVCCK